VGCPGFPKDTLQEGDVIDYSFAAEQIVYSPGGSFPAYPKKKLSPCDCEKNDNVAKKGPHTGTVKGTYSRKLKYTGASCHVISHIAAMKLLLPIIIVLLVTSCSSLTQRTEYQMAEKMVLQLHEGMTFDEVSRIIPLTRNNEVPVVEHGGVWYDVPIGKRSYIQLRFEHPKNGNTYLESELNLPPRVKTKT